MPPSAESAPEPDEKVTVIVTGAGANEAGMAWDAATARSVGGSDVIPKVPTLTLGGLVSAVRLDPSTIVVGADTGNGVGTGIGT
jgi:hypothetical protein